MRSPVLALLVAASLVVLTRTAAAEPGASETTSYRSTTLLVDGAALGMFMGGALLDVHSSSSFALSGGLVTAGVLGLTLGAPVMHARRGHHQRALGSFVLRAGLATAGAAVAVVANNGCYTEPDDDHGGWGSLGTLCKLDYVGHGFLAGALLAVALDAAFMTDETASVGPTWSPQVAVSSEGVRAGVAWSF